MEKNYLFTSESVTEGHPDKMADQISDAILDYIIARDPGAKVACETLVSNGLCVIAGELRTSTYAPMQEIVRDVIRRIGYTDATYGFDYRTAGVLNAVGEQSSDIYQGVVGENGIVGAGDQGLMFGYACDESPTLMPLPITLAHALTASLAKKRKSGMLPFLRPDGKAQVTLRYENEKPVAVDTIVVSTQHSPEVEYTILKEAVIEEIIKPILPHHLACDAITYHVNPTGRFVIGGPQGDAGLTGRKIIVDTYGGSCPHGGGAFSGKDPTKVDRSGAYMARYIAKNLVASKVCTKALVQLSYAIGIATPVSVAVWTYGTARVSTKEIEACIKEVFPLTPAGMIETLDLLQPIYERTAAYGHFGREEEGFNWEKCDKVEAILQFLKMG
ncbi:MAG: methionine adenosyltransferase [Campylobacterales bacterium]|nr:methionine adenosyltransferase [Campylobacterales bacterium]